MKQLALAAMALGLLLPGCFPWSSSKPEALKPRLIPCRRALGKITVDGKLDEADWQRAYTFIDFRVPVTLAKPQRPSSVSFLWDDDCLYFGVVFKDFDITAMKKERDSWTWEDDVCELFLKPSDVANPYYEIHVTPIGTVLDLLFGRRGAGTIDRWKSWDSGIQAAVKVSGTINNWADKDSGWVVEAAIPFKSFEATTPRPQLGDRWRFALSRYNYSVYLDDGLELSSTARLTTTNFHQYEDFDYLDFAK